MSSPPPIGTQADQASDAPSDPPDAPPDQDPGHLLPQEDWDRV
jgi:hypothetical protein